MEDLVNQEQWVVVDPNRQPTTMAKEDWEKLEKKGKKYNSTLPIKFNVVECRWRRQCKEVVVSVKIPGKQVMFSKVVSS